MNILKNILINSSSLSFRVEFHHIKAHQDDLRDFSILSWPAQLNCAVDAGAKRSLQNAYVTPPASCQCFPLEPIICYLGKEKVTSDAGEAVQIWAHRRLAHKAFVDGKILTGAQFDVVVWEVVYDALHWAPHMFQLWACKQVWDIAGIKYLRCKWDETVKKWCLSCRRAKEMAEHVLLFQEAKRVKTLQTTISLLDEWLAKAGTEPGLGCCIIRYASGHGYKTMEEICRPEHENYKIMALKQNKLSWRRFMEEMLSKSLVSIQEEYHCIFGEEPATWKWASQLVIQLLEVVHGQWACHNIQMHDQMKGMLCTEEKEHLLKEIKIEMTLGFNVFLDMDKSLVVVTLEDMEASGGESQEYWLLAVQMAWAAKALTDGLATMDTIPS